MKLLVLGLDGVDRRLIDHFDMPFTQGLLRSLEVLPVKEDLWSRGWVKVLSGLPPTDTGSYYEQPALDGTARFTQGYGSKSYPTGAAKKPLWTEVDALGKRAAWLNLPTMMPAPAINGVVLGGAGGGFSPEQRIPEVACHPTSLRDMFIEDRMIWENRFVVSGIRTMDLFFDKCIETIWRRVKIYVDLVKKNGPMDLGFFVQKEPVIISNIYMYSIELLMAKGKADRAVAYLLNQFFSTLDDTLKYAVDKLGPEQVMVVSDHGMAPFKRMFNVNAILEDAGMLRFTGDAPGNKRDLLTKVKGRLAKEVIDTAKIQVAPSLPPWRHVDHKASKAFSNYYVPGIFLYDQRFGGKAMDQATAIKLENEVLNAFNAHPTAKAHKLVARPFRREHEGAPAYDLLPELWIDHPEDYFPEQQGAAVQDNPYFRDWSDMKGLTRDIGSGKKSSAALCVVDHKFLYNVDPARKDLDLTVVHELVLNHFK